MSDPTPASGSVALRTFAALGASVWGALVCGAVSGALRAAVDRRGGAVRESALFVPIGVLVGALVVMPVAWLISEARWRAFAQAQWEAPGGARRWSASALVAPPAVVLTIAWGAQLNRVFLTAFHNVGLAALAQSVALTGFFTGMVAVALGVRAWTARRVSRTDGRGVLQALGIGIVIAAGLVAVGIRTGDVQGHGRWLGAYGVLKKSELDLGPVYGMAGILGIAAVLTPWLARRRERAVLSFGAAGVVAALLLSYVAQHFNASPSATVIDARPSLARTVLRALRHRTDRDRDGASSLFGGGDCNDHDARIHPHAFDVPENGIDEDCTGRDARRPPPPTPPPAPSVALRAEREVPRDLNLLLITVDTLRWDTHYAGNPRPLTPSLDRLAAESVVFDHGYAMSSYTGRAVGPLLTGRYPTECWRDAEHFTTYLPRNVFLAERLRAVGFQTLGAAAHFYFQRGFGLAQGIDTWDTSITPSMDEQETGTYDARVADRIIAMLRAPDRAQGRFFVWAHFFDPHKQYVVHPELASFGESDRAHYDGEVAWSDRQVGRVLDALAGTPAGARTIVVVTADHGEAFGEHGMSYHGVELWEELVRVPWIIRVPGLTPRHITTARSQIDLVPTLLALLRVDPPRSDAPDALSGVSLVPDLLGEPQPARPVYIELPEGPFNDSRRSVIFEGWKLTERGADNFELWNLGADPGERRNLSHSDAPHLGEMRERFEQVRAGLHPVRAAGEPDGS